MCKEFLPLLVTTEEILKLTSKGQLTLPVRIRRALRLREGDHIYLREVGGLAVLKRVEQMTLRDVSKVLHALARDHSITRQVLVREVRAVRGERWRRHYARAARAPRH